MSIGSDVSLWHLSCDVAGVWRTRRKAEIRDPLAIVMCITATNDDLDAADIRLLRQGCPGWLLGQTSVSQSLSSNKMQCFSYLFVTMIDALSVIQFS